MKHFFAKYTSITRITAVITIICFLSADIAFAFSVSGKRITTETITQPTMFSRGDRSDSLARTAAKYIHARMERDLADRPVAGAEDLLRIVSNIASTDLVGELSADPGIFDVRGAAKEGRIAIRLSGDCVLCYFNPEMWRASGEYWFANDLLCYTVDTIDSLARLDVELSVERIDETPDIQGRGGTNVHEAGAKNIEIHDEIPILDRIESSIGSGEKVLVLITGDPGTGKSTLARTIKTSNTGTEHLCIDDYISAGENGASLLNVVKLDVDLWDAQRRGADVVILEGVNLQFSLNELSSANLGLGGPLHIEMGRSLIAVKAVEEDETRRKARINARSSLATARARLSVRQEEPWDLYTGYDFIYKPGENLPYNANPVGSVYSVGGLLASGMVISYSTGMQWPLFAGVVLCGLVCVAIMAVEGNKAKYGPGENDSKETKLRAFIDLIPKAAKVASSMDEFKAQLDSIAERLSLPLAISRDSREISELIDRIRFERALAERAFDKKDENKDRIDQEKPKLDKAFMIAGMSAGMVAGCAYLCRHLGVYSMPVSAVMSVAAFLVGWGVHEAGHAFGRRYGRYVEVRAGPAASLMSGLVILSLFLSNWYFELIPYVTVDAFLVVSAVSFLVHGLADGFVLIRDRNILRRFRLESMIENASQLLRETPNDERLERELFNRIAGVYKATAGIHTLVERRKKLLQEVLILNVNPMGSPTRRLASEDVIIGLLQDKDPYVWEPALECVIEVIGFMEKGGNESFARRFYDIILQSERLPHFVDAMVKLYIDAHENKGMPLFLSREEFVREVEKVFDRVAEENPIMAERLYDGISRYGGPSWVFYADLAGNETPGVGLFVSALQDREQIFISSDKPDAQRFCESYLRKSLEYCVKRGRVKITDNGYVLTHRGIGRVMKRAKFGAFSYPQIAVFVKDHMSEDASRIINAVEVDMRRKGIAAMLGISEDSSISSDTVDEDERARRLYVIGKNARILMHEVRGLISVFGAMIKDHHEKVVLARGPPTREEQQVIDLVSEIRNEIDEFSEGAKRLAPTEDEEKTKTDRDPEVQAQFERLFGKNVELDPRRPEDIAVDLIESADRLARLFRKGADMDPQTYLPDLDDLYAPVMENMLRRMLYAHMKMAGYVRMKGGFDTVGEIKKVDLNDAVGFVAEQYKSAVKTFRLDHGEPPAVEIDEILITEVLDNIIRNAVQEVGASGKIVVKTSRSSDGRALISVRDNGSGISEEERDRVFGMFYSTRGESGSGIGLAVAKEIVENAGGEIRIETAPEGGAQFNVYLPPYVPQHDRGASATTWVFKALGRKKEMPDGSPYHMFEILGKHKTSSSPDWVSPADIIPGTRGKTAEGTLSPWTVKRDLGVLVDLGLAEKKGKGKDVVYRASDLSPPEIVLAKRVLEYLGARPSADRKNAGRKALVTGIVPFMPEELSSREIISYISDMEALLKDGISPAYIHDRIRGMADDTDSGIIGVFGHDQELLGFAVCAPSADHDSVYEVDVVGAEDKKTGALLLEAVFSREGTVGRDSLRISLPDHMTEVLTSLSTGKFDNISRKYRDRSGSVADKGFALRGDLLSAYDSILSDPFLSTKRFTRSDIRSARVRPDGALYSYTTVADELSGLVKAGILVEYRPDAPFKKIKYRLNQRYRTADKDKTAEVRAILGTLKSKPSDEDLLEVKRKLDLQVFAEGEALIHYYLRRIPGMNLELIKLSSQRAGMKRILKRNPDDKAVRRRFDQCLARIEAIRKDIILEAELLSDPDYPLKRTGGRNFRQEVRDALVAAADLVGAGNEGAAASKLSMARGLLVLELRELSKTRVKPSGPRVWRDIKDHMMKVISGTYVSRIISASREVRVKEFLPHSSSLAFQAVRARDHEIDNMLDEIQWIRGIGKKLSIAADMVEKAKSATVDRRKEPELTAEDKEYIQGTLSEVVEKLAKAEITEKVLPRSAAEYALNLLEIGRYRTMLEELSAVRGLLSRREFSLRGMIENVRKGRLLLLREYISQRNSDIIAKTDLVDELLSEGSVDKAKNILYGMTRDLRIRREPEFSRMLPAVWQAIDKLDDPAAAGTVRRNMSIIRERTRMAEVLNSFMADLRDIYTDARLNGVSADRYDSIFKERFSIYLDFARKNNIGRGSPRVLWSIFYLSAYVSMSVPDPEKPSKKIDNPLFKAYMTLVRLLEINDLSQIVRVLERKKEKYSSLYDIAVRYNNAGFTAIDDLGSGEEYRVFLEMLAIDEGLDGDRQHELIKASYISPEQVSLADMRAENAYFKDIWGEYESEQIGLLYHAGDTPRIGSNNKRLEEYKRLFGYFRFPENWPSDMTEDWEEDFVSGISKMSADELADKFRSYYDLEVAQHWYKDLRSVTSISGIHDDQSFADLYLHTRPEFFLFEGARIPEEQLRGLKEQLWIVREWIYRHWDDMPKENSFDRMKRIAKPTSGGPVPPPGSIYGVFDHMVRHGAVGRERTLSAAQIAGGLNRAESTIAPDIRALAGELGLVNTIEMPDGSRRYYVTERSARNRLKILPVLSRFRADSLRPAAEELKRVRDNELDVFLSVSEEDLRTVLVLASFGHGTNYATEVKSAVEGLLSTDDFLFNSTEHTPTRFESQLMSFHRQLSLSVNSLEELYQKASAAVIDGTISEYDIGSWRSALLEAYARLTIARRIYPHLKGAVGEIFPDSNYTELFYNLGKGMENLHHMLDDRIMLMNGQISGKEVDLNTVVFGIFDELMVRSLHKDRILPRLSLKEHLGVRPMQGSVLVRGNRRSLISMVCNLVGNAYDYSRMEKGEDAHVQISLSVNDKEAIITIKDNGPGMDPEQIRRLKTPFYTTGGTGIGMTEAFFVARDHAGSIDIGSVPGKGSRFVVRIPLASVSEGARAEVEDGSASNGRMTEEEIRMLVSFASFGHGTNHPTEINQDINVLMNVGELISDLLEGDDLSGIRGELVEINRDLRETAELLDDRYNMAVKIISSGSYRSDKDVLTWGEDLENSYLSISGALKRIREMRKDMAEKKDAAPALELIDMLIASAEHIIPVLKERLLLINSESGTDDVDLRAVIGSLEDNVIMKKPGGGPLTKKEYENNISVKIADEGEFRVKGSELGIVSAVCNIVSNGFGYAYQDKGQDARVRVKLKRQGNLGVISIRDNGPGMTPEEIKMARRAFYTTKGTGIGLTEAMLTIKDHLGKVEIKSEPGSGAVFVIVLPLEEREDISDAQVAELISTLSVESDAYPIVDEKQYAGTADRANVPVNGEKLEQEMIAAIDAGILKKPYSDEYMELFDVAPNPTKWKHLVTEEWEWNAIRENSLLSAEDLVAKFMRLVPGAGANPMINGRADLRKIVSFDNYRDTNLADIYGFISYIIVTVSDKPMAKSIMRTARECRWMAIEWLYRHWDDKDRPNSYGLMTGITKLTDVTSTGQESDKAGVLERQKIVVPEIFNGLSTLGYDDTVVLAVDSELGDRWARTQLSKVVRALKEVSSGDEVLSGFLDKVVIKYDSAKDLSRELGSLEERGIAEKENMLIVTGLENRETFFAGFEGRSTITAVDDSEMTEEMYYPLTELILFTLARRLDYSREDFLRCWAMLSNREQLQDEEIWARCWDNEAGRYRSTAVVKLIPGAEAVDEERVLYQEIRRYIRTKA